MQAPLEERFGTVEELLLERYGDAPVDLDVPEFLGGGRIVLHDGPSECPECGGFAGYCARWCSLPRAHR